MRLKPLLAVALCSAFPALLWCGSVRADTDDSGTIDDIQVTARKRAEPVQDVPQSITVYRGQDLEALGQTTSPDIAQDTPNLMWTSILGFSTPNIFLRGIGDATFNANQAGPVGIHQDGVYQGSSVTYGFGLFDLDRVEILKGPQGTLFGRNTTAGVVDFIPNKPDPAAGTNADATATYGRFDEADVEGAAGFALGDDAAVRIAGLVLNRDGYVRNEDPTSGILREGKIALWSTRGQLRVLPNDNIDILVTLHGGENHSDVTPGKQVGVVCPAGVTVPRVGLCSDFFGFTDNTDPRENFTNVRSFDDVDTWGADLTATWKGSGFNIVSQTSYGANTRTLVNDSDTAPLSEIKTNVTSRFHQFSQELRIVSDAPPPNASASNAGQFTWIAGANYYTDDLKAFQNFTANAFGPGGLSHFFTVPEGIASYLDQGTETYAAFGEANYTILPRLTLTLGARWTHDRRDADTHAFIFDATGYGTAFVDQTTADSRLLTYTIPPEQLARAWSNLSGRGILSYAMTDNVLTYASIARGFKGGDFNGGALFGPAEANIVDPEYVTAYEVGFKGATADRRLTFDAAAFLYDFTNQQVAVMVPGSDETLQQLSNAAKTTSKGLEADVSALPFGPLYLDGRVGLLDSKFDRFQLDPANPATNYAGNRTALSPKFSFAGLMRYTIPVSADYAVAIQGDADYKSGLFFTADNNPTLYQPGYWLAGARVTFARADGHLSLAAWVKNIADKTYFVSGLANTGLGFLELIPGLPRTFGLTLSAKY